MAEIGALYKVARDWEADVLDDLRRRAGITWEHVGCWTNQAADVDCERCGVYFRKLKARDEALGAPTGYEP